MTTLADTSPLCCPLDGSPLKLIDKTWRCPSGHSFDVAKQGYVNLLPVQNKRSKDPGDSKSMVQARAEFLGAGYYAPLSDAISAAALRASPKRILDAGCGEGYYLRRLLDSTSEPLTVTGLDISKWAVFAAAKSDKRATWLVASNSHIPLANDSIDTILCVFGFPVLSEFKRVLSAHGRLLMVDPAPQHLAELKSVIYDEVHEKDYPSAVTGPDWALQHEERVQFSVTLPSNEAIRHLLAMTPHLYRASSEGRARAEALESLSVTIDVWVREFGLHNDAVAKQTESQQ